MKRFSILCCLVLLMNLLCPIGLAHADDIASPTDLCEHSYKIRGDEDGHWYYCTECSETKDFDYHKATCTNPGVCKVCGVEGEDIRTEHDFTCTPDAGGKTHSFTCKNCSEIRNYIHQAACTAPNVCIDCGYTGTISWITHQLDIYNDTHDDKGHYYPCLACGEVQFMYHWSGNKGCGAGNTCQYGDCDFVFPAEHNYQQLKSDADEHWYECTVCGDTTGRTSHKASCTTPGVCATCGYKDDKLTAEHTWGNWADGDACVYGCTVCKYEENRGEHMAYCTHPEYCAYCGEVGDWYYDHNWDFYSEDCAISDGPEGHHFVCQDCDAIDMGEHYANCTDPTHCIECGYEGTISIVSHTWGDPVTANGKETYTCTVCGETKEETIPATDTPEPTATPAPTATPEPTATPKPTTKPTTKPDATDVPVTDAPATDVPATDVPATDVPAEEPAHTHVWGVCISAGNGTHSQTCTDCGEVTTVNCTMADAKIGSLDASACIYCGYITWKQVAADATAQEGKQDSKPVESATFAMLDADGAAAPVAENITLVVYEAQPEATIELDTGAKVAVKKALTIALLEDNAPITLTSAVKLNIPVVEEEMTGLKLLVMDENGELVEIEYEIIDGVMTFETEILGIFLLVEEI